MAAGAPHPRLGSPGGLAPDVTRGARWSTAALGPFRRGAVAGAPEARRERPGDPPRPRSATPRKARNLLPETRGRKKGRVWVTPLHPLLGPAEVVCLGGN